MAADGQKKLMGRIILVQEDRFRMVDSTGKGYLFTLSRKAPLSQEDLQRFHNTDIRVLIEYEGEPNTSSGVAHTVEPYSEIEEVA